MHTYKAKVVERITTTLPDGRLSTRHIRVGVFRVEGDIEEQVGEYIRDYALLNTFFYFRKGDGEYALYSPNHSATRIMKLPSCRDIGGEEPATGGFCPVEFYVPSYIVRERVYDDNRALRYRVHEPSSVSLTLNTTQHSRLDQTTGEKVEYEERSYPITPHLYYPFGFIAGCIWGDDTSWKIQFLDLAEVEKGILKRDDRFGYIVLPNKMSLRTAIDMTDYDPDDKDPYLNITITLEKRFDLQTGEMQDY